MPLPTDRIVLEGTPTDTELEQLSEFVRSLGGDVLGVSPLRLGGTAVALVDLSEPERQQVIEQAGKLGLTVRTTQSYADGTIRPTFAGGDGPHARGVYGVDRGHGDGWRLVDERFVWRSPGWDPVDRGDRRPVVAVVDSGVQPHTDLPAAADDPFLLSLATGSPRPDPDPAFYDVDRKTVSGHATFIAGLIHLFAPTAQVLSVDVMDENGLIDEVELAGALGLLLEYKKAGNPVDVLSMSFGRQLDTNEGEDSPTLIAVEDALKELAAEGVQLVASAGNYGTLKDGDTPLGGVKVFPAAFTCVTAVGAGRSATEREDYSSYGPWVEHWRPGNAISLMPRDNWAMWTGTSFSCAIYAAELAPRVG
jgi:hypothetical protein